MQLGDPVCFGVKPQAEIKSGGGENIVFFVIDQVMTQSLMQDFFSCGAIRTRRRNIGQAVIGGNTAVRGEEAV